MDPPKRPVRLVPIAVKLEAIDKVADGATKASISRMYNVPESTLRGWCKNKDQLQALANIDTESPVSLPAAKKPKLERQHRRSYPTCQQRSPPNNADVPADYSGSFLTVPLPERKDIAAVHPKCSPITHPPPKKADLCPSEGRKSLPQDKLEEPTSLATMKPRFINILMYEKTLAALRPIETLDIKIDTQSSITNAPNHNKIREETMYNRMASTSKDLPENEKQSSGTVEEELTFEKKLSIYRESYAQASFDIQRVLLSEPFLFARSQEIVQRELIDRPLSIESLTRLT